MDLKGKLRKGLKIFGADNRDYGTIDRYDERYAYVGDRRIPMSAFERMDNDHLYIGDQDRQYFETTDHEGTGRIADEGEIRVQVREERLNVEKRQGEMGSVDIRKDVTTEQVNVPVELRHEEVTVNRVDVRDRPVAVGEMAGAFEEGTIRVPVRGEEAVVTKEAVVTGEVVINKERTTERQQVTDTVRKEVIHVDENYDRHRAAYEQEYAKRQPPASTRFADVEPHFRTGYGAAVDPKNAKRSWEEVEPDLRQRYSGQGGGDAWERVKREVREGFTRARQS
jgi:uncharacterized protein (TIGR02271 family)